MNWIEFLNELQGYKFFDKNGTEIFKWQLFWNKLTPTQVFKKYKSVVRVRENSY